MVQRKASRFWRAAWRTAPQNYVRDAAIALILQPRAFRTNAIYAMNLKHHLEDMQKTYEHMPGTQNKLLIIHGDKDRTVNIDYNAASLLASRPDVELLELVGAGHLLHHTWKREITAEIMRFLLTAKPRRAAIYAAKKVEAPCRRC